MRYYCDVTTSFPIETLGAFDTELNAIMLSVPLEKFGYTEDKPITLYSNWTKEYIFDVDFMDLVVAILVHEYLHGLVNKMFGEETSTQLDYLRDVQEAVCGNSEIAKMFPRGKASATP